MQTHVRQFFFDFFVAIANSLIFRIFANQFLDGMHDFSLFSGSLSPLNDGSFSVFVPVGLLFLSFSELNSGKVASYPSHFNEIFINQ